MGSQKSKPAEAPKHAIQPLPLPGYEASRKYPIPNLTANPPPRSAGLNPNQTDHERWDPPPPSEIPRADFSHSSKLRRPQGQRPIEPSWLHQSNTNERYKHIEAVQTRDHDDEYLHRRQIAINRWHDDDFDSETKTKSFFDEYIHP